jgi:hypothetical protein
MTIQPQTLRAMRDELVKMAAPADRRLAAALAKAEGTPAPKPGLLTRLRGAVVDRPLRAGAGELVEGGVERLEGPLKTRVKALSGEAGEEAARGFLRGVTPSKKTLALGAGAAGLGAYGLHRARKRRKQDTQRAVAAGVQQGLRQAMQVPEQYSPAMLPA